MKKYPLPVLIVAILLLIAGVVGFFYHLQDFADPHQNALETTLVELLRIAAIVAGLLLLRARRLGRWLAIGWVLLHVVISAFNTVDQLLMHIGVLIVVGVLLFLPVSNHYFKQNK